MTILEKINETEQKAETIKLEAKQEVSEMLEKVNKDNLLKTEEMMNDAKKQVQKMYEENDIIIKELVDASVKESDKININNQNLAKIHLNETVDFIMKKVIDS
ncbi:MAG: hypothetical protein SOZ32_06420 [Bacilli bacterium]|nr:hypothetical protein [Mollicutes bacterium]MDY3899815.1 hypothetical protein [Bacilli bacterium]